MNVGLLVPVRGSDLSRIANTWLLGDFDATADLESSIPGETVLLSADEFLFLVASVVDHNVVVGQVLMDCASVASSIVEV